MGTTLMIFQYDFFSSISRMSERCKPCGTQWDCRTSLIVGFSSDSRTFTASLELVMGTSKWKLHKKVSVAFFVSGTHHILLLHLISRVSDQSPPWIKCGFRTPPMLLVYHCLQGFVCWVLFCACMNTCQQLVSVTTMQGTRSSKPHPGPIESFMPEPVSSIHVLWDGTIFNSSNGRLKVAQMVVIQILQIVTLADALKLNNWTGCQIRAWPGIWGKGMPRTRDISQGVLGADY